jgi:2-C-methyl-D-erythritol 4-phosphate cytidylyltransferase
MQTVAVVLAGGSGRRFGGSMPKHLQLLAGRTLVEHCVAAFDAAPCVDEVLVVIGPEFVAQATADLSGYAKLTGVITGGAARTDSTRAAIVHLAAQARERNVLFHDAARPLVDQQIIADSAAALERWQAIGVVVPSSDTIVEVAAGTLGRVLPRDSLARCQTPQGFRLSVIRRAYELADADPAFAALSATDDCGVVRRYLPEVPIGSVPGHERNIKVTYPGDLEIAEILLRRSRPGPVPAAEAATEHAPHA